MKKTVLVLFCLILTLTFLTGASAQVISPEDYLGFKPGTEKKLADTKQIFGYFIEIAPLSAKITVSDLGKTTEGNPFLMAVISSEENIKNLNEFLKIQDKLTDQRTTDSSEIPPLIEKGKTVVLINCSIHSTEVGAAQMSMQLAYDLITGTNQLTQTILDNVILLLVPIHNPDGTQLVADWYKKYLGTKYEGASLPWLYQKYTGHDNNRDWFMFTQNETRLTVEKIHNVWHPQIVVDMHQMGARGARLFVPPYIDPYEPNIDPVIMSEAAMLGTFISSEMTARGLAGVIFSSGYDAFTPARAYQHYHGGVRILTEAASCNIATPVTVDKSQLRKNIQERSWNFPLPWEGGEWTLNDIITYDKAAVMAVLTHAARNRESWLRNFAAIFKHAINFDGTPFAYVFPADQTDQSLMQDLIGVLRTGDVEINEAAEEFTINDYTYKKGAYIVYSKQPFGGFARAMLSKRQYPKIEQYPGGPLRRPYDATAHCLPLLMNLQCEEIKAPFTVKTVPVKSPEPVMGKLTGSKSALGYFIPNTSLGTVRFLNALPAHEPVYLVKDAVHAGKNEFKPGTVFIPAETAGKIDLSLLVKSAGVHAYATDTKITGPVLEYNQPRVSLYKPWTASIDEGWTRFLLEEFNFHFQNIFNKDIRTGNLISKYDVIIIPDLLERSILAGRREESVPKQYAGGIGDTGIRNLREFVEAGGCLITLNRSCQLPMDKFWLGAKNTLAEVKRKQFYIPGSILQVIVDPAHPVAYGYGREVPVFFSNSPALSVSEGTCVGNYPEANLLLSGWITGEKYLHGKTALADIPLGKGRVILFGFRPQFRAQSRGTFKLFFNAIYYGAAKEITLKNQ